MTESVCFPTFVASVNGTLPDLEVKCMLLSKGQYIVLGSASVKKMYSVMVEANQMHNSTLYPHLKGSLVYPLLYCYLLLFAVFILCIITCLTLQTLN